MVAQDAKYKKLYNALKAKVENEIMSVENTSLINNKSIFHIKSEQNKTFSKFDAQTNSSFSLSSKIINGESN